jgi:DNA-binding transcriptional MerR regulator
LSDIDFSSLPNKKYYSISEVSTLLGIKQTEIRYWEKFEPKLRSKGTTRAYDLKKLKILIDTKKLIKDQGIKPAKIGLYLSNKKIRKSNNLDIKKELINIKNLIKKASKV